MAQNFPGPYEVEILYTFDSLTHVMRLNCDLETDPAVGDPPDSFNVKFRSGSAGVLDDNVQAFITLLRPLFTNATSFSLYNVWKYTPGTFEKTFITSGDISVVGTNVGFNNNAGQRTLTFRTQEGGIMKIVLLEPVVGNNDIKNYVDADPDTQDLMDSVTAPSNWILARDTSYPIVPYHVANGQNEAVFRKRYR